jgi:hypothetical protein
MSSPALPHPIDRFVEAVHRGDTRAFLAFFPKDGVVIDSGRRFADHDAILGWSDREFIGAHGHMTVKKVEQKKNVVMVKADWKKHTLVARKPMAKRVENACKNIARDLSGCLPKTTIEASSKPNTMPHKMPKITRFMANLVSSGKVIRP